MNNLKSKWYNTGYEDGKAGLAKKKLPYYIQNYYNSGYKVGKKYSIPKRNLWNKICVTSIVLFIALIVYYCNVYLCADSPIVPMRCKAFPWEE